MDEKARRSRVCAFPLVVQRLTVDLGESNCVVARFGRVGFGNAGRSFHSSYGQVCRAHGCNLVSESAEACHRDLYFISWFQEHWRVFAYANTSGLETNISAILILGKTLVTMRPRVGTIFLVKLYVDSVYRLLWAKRWKYLLYQSPKHHQLAVSDLQTWS